MAEKILGLDIGSYSIKAALFEATFRTYELKELYESSPLNLEERSAEDKTNAVMKALQTFLEQNQIPPATLSTALAGSWVSTRRLNLPLPANQVQKVLPFELENFIPFPLQEVLIESCTIESSKTKTDVLAFAVGKEPLSKHLDILKKCNLDPAFVSIDSVALANLFLLDQTPSGLCLIVDIGHTKTSLSFLLNGQLRFVRTLFTGGLNFTHALQKKLDLTFEQAQEVKHTHGIVDTQKPFKSEDLKRLSAAVTPLWTQLIAQIQQTIGSYLSQERELGQTDLNKLDHIYLCGGSSLFRDLPPFFEQHLGVSTSRIHIFEKLFSSSPGLVEKEPFFTTAVGLGVRAAIRGNKTKEVISINFRKDEFSFAKDMSDIKDKVLFFARWVAVIFALGFLQQGLRMIQLGAQKSRSNKQVLVEYKKLFPDEKKQPKSAEVALKEVQTKIRQMKSKQEILTAGLSDLTALQVLKEISNLIPASIPLDTQELSIDRNKITFRGTTDSLGSIDQIVSALQSKKEFGKLEIGDRKESTEGKKTFSMTITIEDPNAPKDLKQKKKKS